MNSGLEQNIKKIVQSYPSCLLQNLDEASLMNRVDTKFIVPAAMILELLQVLREDFSALEINGERIFRYENIYYDTPQFLLYKLHHQGKLNRHKVRVRKYLDSKTQYLEVKFKNNKKRTVKTRVELPNNYSEDLVGYRGFLEAEEVPEVRNLRPSQRSRYQRIALISQDAKERVTIDVNLRHKILAGNTLLKTSMEGLAIIELKQNRLSRESPFYSLMKSKGIRPSKISKYCVGLMMASMKDPLVKYNRFKVIARRVAKVSPTKELVM